MSDNDLPSAVPVNPFTIRVVQPKRILSWLGKGWHDIWRSPGPSLLHGLLIILISAAILFATQWQWQLVMIASSCFLLACPWLATGLYALSKASTEQQSASYDHALRAWKEGSQCLFRFGLLLLLACAAWSGMSLLLYYLFVDVSILDPVEFLRYVLTQHDGLFLLWLISGGLVSGLVFGITVISMPLLVDRDVSTWIAIKTSIRAVGENTVTMVCWASTIVLLTMLSFATGLLGFLLIYPLLGHASWHAYRDLIAKDPSRS